jgi:AcrR family transcriptional regulator
VAIDHFGRFGFDGAATRDIAREAGTAMSSITYHFGGKQGLYLACADHIGEQISSRQQPVFEAVGDPSGLSREEAIEAMIAFAGSFAAMMIDPRSQGWARFIVREQQEPTEAFERLWRGVMGRALDLASRLMSRIDPRLDDRERVARVFCIFGQTLVLRQARASVCRALGVSALGEAESALLQQQIAITTRAILTCGD